MQNEAFVGGRAPLLIVDDTQEFVVPLDASRVDADAMAWAVAALWSNAYRVPVTRIEIVKGRLSFWVTFSTQMPTDVANVENLRSEIQSVLSRCS